MVAGDGTDLETVATLAKGADALMLAVGRLDVRLYLDIVASAAAAVRTSVVPRAGETDPATGAERYTWLNDVVCVGSGYLSGYLIEGGIAYRSPGSYDWVTGRGDSVLAEAIRTAQIGTASASVASTKTGNRKEKTSTPGGSAAAGSRCRRTAAIPV